MLNKAILFLIVASFIYAVHANEFKENSNKINYETLDMGKSCKIRFIISANFKYQIGNGGNPKNNVGGITIYPIPNAWKSNMDTLTLSFSCKEKNYIDNPQPSGIYDKKLERWKKDPKELRNYLKQSQDYSDPDFLNSTIAAMRVYDIKTPNAQGWADTSDQLTGDDAGRTRYMSFCIYHASKALCGLGKVGLLRDGPRGDLVPHALKILRSIEFLE